MNVLSVEDIDLMIALVDNQKLPSELVRHEKQMDKLICMGIIRPGGGVLALTELGYKTANGLLGRCLGSTVDGPVGPSTKVVASSVVAEAHAEDHRGPDEAGSEVTSMSNAASASDAVADSDAAAATV